ncbi:aspartate aminotransferase family protein [Candidatus Dojkabacteria bacterium]|uniref:Aspartate aminotransferase family protein n=1 Tax=Candidatus Dojkabacteria bacterium TaxID=2099670 RepID=A0A955L7S7_9BACT|nr:aspartate aminotransferase family protein [Candidatus Dojkabacteria bacterium]
MITKHQLTQQRSIVGTYANRGITIIRGEGNTLIDTDGNTYIDMMSNYGASTLGYGRASISQQLSQQIDTLMLLHGSFNNDQRSEATQELLLALGTKNYSHIYWSNSGSEAIEAALKFATLTTNKHTFLAAHNGYHGKTFGALSATSSNDGKYQSQFKNMLLDFEFFEYNDMDSFKNALNNNISAVLLEPIQGEGGIIKGEKSFLREVAKLCKQNEILLIFDEIQTGCGRTGTFLASEGIEADIVCLAKGLGAGIPVGATIVTSEIATKIPRGIHTSTFGGNPLAMAGVRAMLSYLDNNSILEHVQEVSRVMENELKKLQIEFPHHIVSISQSGLMIGIEFAYDPMPILKSLQDNFILAAPASKNRMRFLPPLTITEEELLQACEILHSILLSK